MVMSVSKRAAWSSANVPASSTDTSLDCTLAMNTRPAGSNVTPNGARPAGTVATTCKLARSTTLTLSLSRLATNSRVPAGSVASPDGDCPT